ncbi:MAG: hypothetical protein OXF31_12640 [Gammaproteobacteria bacterium]|nr:hypothetical protein [Gammaproteobacteria bacterium]
MESYYSTVIVPDTLLQEKFPKTKFFDAYSVAFHLFLVEADNLVLMNHYELAVVLFDEFILIRLKHL